jgi:hypothetical protein
MPSARPIANTEQYKKEFTVRLKSTAKVTVEGSKEALKAIESDIARLFENTREYFENYPALEDLYDNLPMGPRE